MKDPRITNNAIYRDSLTVAVDLTKSGKFKKTFEMFGFDGEYTADHPRGKTFFCENWAVKHCIEKPILLKFVNLLNLP